MTTEIRFFALKSKKEKVKRRYWIQVRTVFNVKTTTTVDPMLSASGNLFKWHEEVLYLQPSIPPKRFDIFSPITGGCSEGLGVL